MGRKTKTLFFFCFVRSCSVPPTDTKHSLFGNFVDIVHSDHDDTADPPCGVVAKKKKMNEAYKKETKGEGSLRACCHGGETQRGPKQIKSENRICKTLKA
ncbi:hypothetical protein QOT17_003504 [Balamuthia mandrillaris]